MKHWNLIKLHYRGATFFKDYYEVFEHTYLKARDSNNAI